ncbi:hypothetical protein DMUE_0073 [Dictyocoela muelleri]|nr:hypothetical protein DMUE_0073 [Dictyocoela muelleri]
MAIEYLSEFNDFAIVKSCSFCGNLTNRRKKDSKRLNSFYYYCTLCLKKSSSTKGTAIERFKKPLFIFLRVVYGFVANFDYCQMETLEINQKLYTKTKKY